MEKQQDGSRRSNSARSGVADGASDIWEQTFDAVSDPVSIVDAQYHVLASNAAYKRAFGCTGDSISQHPCFAAAGSEHPCEGCPLSVTLATGAPHMVRQERLVRVDGAKDGDAGAWERRVYQRWTYPLVDSDGSARRVVEILRDVTERERLAQVRIEAEAWRRADQLKAELLGAVSHELRSPLTTIRGYADTLTRHEARLTAEERHEYLSAISAASERLSVEVERLLLYSRLESGDERLDSSLVDVTRLVNEAVHAIQARAPRRLSIAVRVRGAASLAVLGDTRRLREAIDALLDNALTYASESGEISVTMSAVDMEMGGASVPAVEIVVRDDGRGIPPESQPRIFDAFHRVENGLTRAVEGIGLGLALCKRIVTLTGGRLSVESEPGNGSAFTILLPAAAQGAPEGDPARSPISGVEKKR